MGKHHLGEPWPPIPAELPADCYDVLGGRYFRHRVSSEVGVRIYGTPCGRIGIAIPEGVSSNSKFLLDCSRCFGADPDHTVLDE